VLRLLFDEAGRVRIDVSQGAARVASHRFALGGEQPD
jgi:hypothetical protein